jgi:hypothetical protein
MQDEETPKPTESVQEPEAPVSQSAESQMFLANSSDLEVPQLVAVRMAKSHRKLKWTLAAIAAVVVIFGLLAWTGLLYWFSFQ